MTPIFKKILVYAVILSLVLEDLVACNSQVGAATLNFKNSQIFADSDLTDRSGIWANHVRVDLDRNIKSKIDFVADNATMNDFELVGCSNDKMSTGLESNIEAGYIFPRTTMFDPTWSLYADSNGSIIDPSSIERNSLSFDLGKVTKDSNYHNYCYYKIYYPEVGEYQYIKLNIDYKSFATDGPTGKNTKTAAPYQDSHQVEETSVAQDIKSGRITLAQLEGAANQTWSSQRDAEMSLTDYVNSYLENGWQNSLEDINRYEMISYSYTQPQKLNNSLKARNMEQITAVENELINFFSWLKIKNYKYNAYIIATDSVKDIAYIHIDRYFDYRDIDPHGRLWEVPRVKVYNSQEQKIGEWILFKNSDSNYNKMLDEFGIPLHDRPIDHYNPVVGRYFDVDYTEKEIGLVMSEITEADELSAVMSENKYVRRRLLEEGENIGLDSRSALKEYTEEAAQSDRTILLDALEAEEDGVAGPQRRVSSSLLKETLGTAFSAGILISGILTTVILPRKRPDYPIGKSKTGVMMLSLDVPSDSNANDWNSSHPENIIKANTKVTTDPKGHNDSLIHSKIYTFKDESIDQSVGSILTLSALSIPWNRGVSEKDEDIYLGHVKGYDTPRFGDAVIGLNLNKITDVSPISDAKFKFLISNYANLGVSELSQDNRLPAPEYRIDSIINIQHKNTLYKTGMNSILYNGHNGLVKVHGIEGISLNDKQETKLNVKIPANGSNDTSNFGGGFGARLYSQSEDGEIMYTSIKSSLIADRLLNSERAPDYFYNKFDCPVFTKVGEDCNLTLRIGGSGNHKKAMQKIYIADAFSKTTSIPVYLNYHLVSEPQSQVATYGDPTPIKIMVKNFGSEDYKEIKISGVPEGAKLVSNSDGQKNCNMGLASGSSCELSYDVSRVENGSYTLLVYGVNHSGRIPISEEDSDASAYTLNVDGGF